jgi:SagB-type dehydrogenase family enzyme
MKTRKIPILLIIAFMMNPIVNAQDLKLPDPDRIGGIPLMKALDLRSSTREYDSLDLSDDQLSDVLWAAWGINRPDEGKHTAPSSNNRQEMSVYAAMKSGLWLYVPETHSIRKITSQDIRKKTGKQDFVAHAALDLIYVADLAKAGIPDPVKAGPEKLNSSFINTGFMAQNVYLCCASLGLACVVRGWFDADELAPAMGLPSHQRIIITQTVGHRAH